MLLHFTVLCYIVHTDLNQLSHLSSKKEHEREGKCEQKPTPSKDMILQIFAQWLQTHS